MKIKILKWLLAIGLPFACGVSHGQWSCIAPELSSEQIREIVRIAREKYTNLPRPAPHYRWYVARTGCHYEYSEHPQPVSFGSDIRFSIN